MKTLLKNLWRATFLVFTTAWISGCAVHPHASTATTKPAKMSSHNPQPKNKPTHRADPRMNVDPAEADESLSERHSPPPPSPPTY